MRIPTDTIARLSHLLPDEPSDDPFNCFRLDNGLVMATLDKKFMAVEYVGGWEGVYYIRADRAMIEQCRTEAQWSSVVDFSPVPQVSYTTAISTMGWKSSDNLGLFPTEPTDYDHWRERILQPCMEPLDHSSGPVVFDAEGLSRLAQSSPSGGIALELNSDPIRRPTVVRDIDSADWVGFFMARIMDGRTHSAAVVPGWCK